MESSLHQIIYISTASPQLTESELMKLLAGSQKRNQAREITGLLLHSDGNIIQVIEGPKNEVDTLYQKIAADSRHKGVTLISTRPIEQRDFPEYKMGFKRTERGTFEQKIPGFTDVVERRNLSEKDLEGVSKLVATFIKTFAKTTNITSFESE